MAHKQSFWGAGIAMVGGILFTLFGRVHLQINQAEISLSQELFGFKYSLIPKSSRQEVNRLQLIERTWKKDADGDQIKVPPAMIIWAGKHEYKLELSEPELEWLVS